MWKTDFLCMETRFNGTTYNHGISQIQMLWMIIETPPMLLGTNRNHSPSLLDLCPLRGICSIFAWKCNQSRIFCWIYIKLSTRLSLMGNPNLETSIFKEILIVCFWSSPHEIDDRKPFPYLFVYVPIESQPRVFFFCQSRVTNYVCLCFHCIYKLLQIIIKLKVWKKNLVCWFISF